MPLDKEKLMVAVDGMKHPLYSAYPSINQARNEAEILLESCDRHDVAQALDTYHNTVIEEVKKKIENV